MCHEQNDNERQFSELRGELTELKGFFMCYFYFCTTPEQFDRINRLPGYPVSELNNFHSMFFFYIQPCQWCSDTSGFRTQESDQPRRPFSISGPATGEVSIPWPRQCGRHPGCEQSLNQTGNLIIINILMPTHIIWLPFIPCYCEGQRSKFHIFIDTFFAVIGYILVLVDRRTVR